MKSTKYYSNKQETFIAKNLGGRYKLKMGRRSDAFKQYLRDRGLDFEPTQNGNYTEFAVLNADESVDRRIINIIKWID